MYLNSGMRFLNTKSAPIIPSLSLVHSIFIIIFVGVFISNIKAAVDRHRMREQVREEVLLSGVATLVNDIARIFLTGDSISTIQKTLTNPSVKINHDTGVIELNIRLVQNRGESNYVLLFAPLDQSNSGYWIHSRSSDHTDIPSYLIWRCLSAEVLVYPLPTHIPRGTLPSRYAPVECR